MINGYVLPSGSTRKHCGARDQFQHEGQDFAFSEKNGLESGNKYLCKTAQTRLSHLSAKLRIAA